jgi:hypothetical protein
MLRNMKTGSVIVIVLGVLSLGLGFVDSGSQGNAMLIAGAILIAGGNMALSIACLHSAFKDAGR